MKRIRALTPLGKGLFLLMLAMAVVFSVLFFIRVSRVGFAYRDVILTPRHENGSTLYSGRLWGKETVFTVRADRTVLLRHGEKSYGPYTAREDPAAAPKGKELPRGITGVRLYRGEALLFSGGVLSGPGYTWLYNPDGSLNSTDPSLIMTEGILKDQDGNILNQAEPSPAEILALMGEPELNHKGSWGFWILGVFICGLNALSILFAEEIFRWNLQFIIRNTQAAEPSDWQILARHISWVLLAAMALAVFILGLQ